MVVLNDGTGFKAIRKSQNGEKKASVSCYLPRNRSESDIGMVLLQFGNK